MFIRIFMVALVTLSLWAMPTQTQPAQAKFFLLHALERINEELDKVTPSSSITSESQDLATNVSKKAQDDSRWILVYQTPTYNLFVDKRSLKYSGTAQYRKVSAYFKKMYTPIGSQELGNSGKVKPDTITHSITHLTLGTSQVDNNGYEARSYGGYACLYFDVHNNLIYEGNLDWPSHYGEKLYPGSTYEKIRDILFKANGWDY